MKTADIRMRVLSWAVTAAKIAVVSGIIIAGLYNIFMFVKTHDVIAVPKEEREIVEFYLDRPEWAQKKIIEYNETIVNE